MSDVEILKQMNDLATDLQSLADQLVTNDYPDLYDVVYDLVLAVELELSRKGL